MPNLKYRAILLVTFTAGLILHGDCRAQDVPPEYRKYFYSYSDKRSMLEKALNIVGLTNNDVGKSFALIAGVSKYPKMGYLWRELRPADVDIQNLSEYLKTEEFFDEIVVLENENMTLGNLQYFLQTYFPKQLKSNPKSRFLFAYSGHGMEEGKKGYLLTFYAEDFADKQNSVPLTVLRDLVQEDVDAGYQVLVLINACYASPFISRPAGGTLMPKRPGAHAITAGGSSEKTWSLGEVGPGSVFFEKLLTGLGGPADIFPKGGGDGIITFEELATYLTLEVKAATDQHQNPLTGDLTPGGSSGGFFFLNRQRQIAKGTVHAWTPKKATPFGSEEEDGIAEAQELIVMGDIPSARAVYKRLADKGSTRAMIDLGVLTDPTTTVTFGDETIKRQADTLDVNEALRWYRAAADKGSLDAMKILGLKYWNGIAVPQDMQQAIQWMHKAANSNDSDAMLSLGLIYEALKPPDYQNARLWYEKAAATGNAEAMDRMGSSFDHEEGDQKDYSQAVIWFQKSAEAGNTAGMRDLGAMYASGHGVQKDTQQAIYWLARASDNGDLLAMELVAFEYSSKKTPEDDKKAFSLWDKLAKRPNPPLIALFELGMAYENGRGVPVDRQEAVNWYRKGSALGDDDAKGALKRLGAPPQ